jgi:hypothetical protein
MPRWERREQARRAFATRAVKGDQRNSKTCVALEAKALWGDGIGIPAALAAVTATLQTNGRLGLAEL